MLKEKLKKLMKEKGLNPHQLSVATGIPYSSVLDWIKGVTTPKTDKLIKLANFFEVSIEYFIKEV